MGKVRIAIFSGYGSNYIPDMFKGKIKEVDTVGSRVKLAKLIDELEVNASEDKAEEAREELNNNKRKYIKFENNPQVYFYSKGISWLYSVKIVDIDTTKPWRICEYDGGEYIDIFDGVTVKDEEYNMCEW